MKRKETTHSDLSPKTRFEPTFIFILPLSITIFDFRFFDVSPHGHACCKHAHTHTHESESKRARALSVFTTSIYSFICLVLYANTLLMCVCVHRYFIIQSSKFSNAYFIRFEASVTAFHTYMPLF